MDELMKERKIPVFTVEKNGAILKNIFVLNSNSSTQVSPVSNQAEEEEETVIVGRHPDCNIVLTHPSISRFHLQINTNSSSHYLSVTDLGSVHGTWISGNRIHPGLKVLMAEGDTLKLGCSSRLHRLHWISYSLAYDMECPFVLSDAAAMPTTILKHQQHHDDEEAALSTHEIPLAMTKTKEETYYQGDSFQREDIDHDSQVNEGNDAFQCVPHDYDSWSSEESNEIQQLDLILEDICSLFSDNNSGLALAEEQPSLPPEHENMKTIICDHGVKETLPDCDSTIIEESNEIQLMNLILENICSLFSDDDSALAAVEEVPLSYPEYECMKTSICDHEAEETQADFDSRTIEESNEIQELDLTLENICSLFSDGESGLAAVEDNTLLYPEHVCMKTSIYDHEAEETQADCDSQIIEESNEIQELDLILENNCSLFSDDTSGLAVVEENPLTYPEHENMKIESCNHETKETQPDCDYRIIEESNEVQPLDLFLENICSLITDNNSTIAVVEENLLTSIEQENMKTAICDHEERETQPETSLSPVREIISEKRQVNTSPPPNKSNPEDLVEDQSLNNQFTKAKSPCYKEYSHHLEGDLANSITRISATEHIRQISTLPTESVNSSNPVKPLTEISDYNKESQTPQSLFINSGRSELQNLQSSEEELEKRSALGSMSRSGQPSTGVLIQIDTTRENNVVVGIEESRENFENRTKATHLSAGLEGTENEVYTSENECSGDNFKNRSKTPFFAGLEGTENEVNTSESKNIREIFENGSKSKPLSADLEETENRVYTPNKENASPSTPVLKSLQKSSSKVGKLKNLGSRKFSPFPKIFGREENFEEVHSPENEVYTPNKENISPSTRMLKSLQMGSGNLGKLKYSNSIKCSPLRIAVPKIFGREQSFEEEFHSPEKENYSPNSLLLRSKKKGKVGELKNSTLGGLAFSNVTYSPPKENLMAFSHKENQNSKVLQLQKSARQTSENRENMEQQTMVTKERAPLQSLLENFGSKRKSKDSVSVATQTVNLAHCTEYTEKKIPNSPNNSTGEGKKKWTMVVDTASLLDKESRKALQLLQGLKGTQIVFPRMVIRELDCLKRHSSFFRRREVSAVLDWIEECMVKTDWWIHVQSSVEQKTASAPTPPATPQGYPCEGNGVFSNNWSLSEVATPTAEDHILECALLFKTMKKDDGQLVLLSNDVTLKIKAMAEGLLCETAEEFRESLMNPFSERFLWTHSSPRGRTWSHLDDVVLREKYDHQFPSRKSFKEGGAKGLKLILLHNSHYGQKSSFR